MVNFLIHLLNYDIRYVLSGNSLPYLTLSPFLLSVYIVYCCSDDVLTLRIEPSQKPTLCNQCGDEKVDVQHMTTNCTTTPSLLMAVELYNDSDDSTIPVSEGHLIDERLI